MAGLVWVHGIERWPEIQLAQVGRRSEVDGLGRDGCRRPHVDRHVVVISHAKVEDQTRPDGPVVLHEGAELRDVRDRDPACRTSR